MRRIIFFSFLIVLFFNACSSKNQVKINDKVNSFSLNKDIFVAPTPTTVKSPVAIGIGLGGYISRHIGIHVGTHIRPDISNDEALKLERAINVNNLSLSDMIASEFDRQMSSDSEYKDKYVPFGADFSVHLFVQKYYLDTATFSSKASPKILIDIKMFNKFGEVVYDDVQENDTLGRYYIYNESDILNSREVLIKALNMSIQNCVAKIILNMKKN